MRGVARTGFPKKAPNVVAPASGTHRATSRACAAAKRAFDVAARRRWSTISSPCQMGTWWSGVWGGLVLMVGRVCVWGVYNRSWGF
jgi:hypothetical protein